MKRKQRRHLLNQSSIKQIMALFICFVLLFSNIPVTAAEKPTDNQTVKAGISFLRATT